MSRYTLVERIISVIATTTLFVCFLVGVIVLQGGCGDMDDGPTYPRIVSTDPPRQIISYEELNWYGAPPYVMRMKRDDVQTITVTFSSPPEILSIGDVWNAPVEEWSVDGRILTLSVVCFNPSTYENHLEYPIDVTWVGGGALLRLWCPLEDDE